jgi:hypothetical protein
MNIAGFTKSGKPWVNPHVKGKDRQAVMRHQRGYIKARSNKKSISASIKDANREEYRGMTKAQIRKHNARLGAKARHHLSKRRSYRF